MGCPAKSNGAAAERFPTYISHMRIPTVSALLGAMLLASGAASLSARPAFQELLFNTHWYRTFDSASSIIPAEGGLLYAWDYSDPEKHADSFFVGIDTLW